MAECRVPFSGHFDLDHDLWPSFYSNHTVRPSFRPSRFVSGAYLLYSPIFFEVEIPNLICGCILGWWSVAYHFWVTVILTLTSDLAFRIIVYLLYYLK